MLITLYNGLKLRIGTIRAPIIHKDDLIRIILSLHHFLDFFMKNRHVLLFIIDRNNNRQILRYVSHMIFSTLLKSHYNGYNRVWATIILKYDSTSCFKRSALV